MNLMPKAFRAGISVLRAIPKFFQRCGMRARQMVRNSSERHNYRRRGQLAIFCCFLLLGAIATQVSAYEPPNNTPTNSKEAIEIAAPSLGPIHQREFRGVWAASVANIDWPSRKNLSVQQQKAELIGILNRMQELNLNALILQVRPAGDAFYASQLEPWSYWLTGQQGQAPYPFYDPLEFAIQEAHRRNIELHAWFNPYRARNQDPHSLAANHMASKYPQYAYQYGNLLWMDPGAPEVQNQTYNVIMDVARRYDVDGIHLDDYFYPYPQGNRDFPDYNTYNAYRRSGGTLSLGDWRRNNVNQLVQRLHSGIKAEKPYIKFGISPFGIYRPGQPPGIVGLDQYDGIYADPKLWLEKGWVDYIAPQLYWRIDPPQQSYPVLLDWWTQQNPRSRHIYTGNYLSQLGKRGWSIAEFERQVAISRQEASRFSLGNIFFSVKVFQSNRLGINDIFKTEVYPTPALVPPMPWIDNEPPEPPTGVSARYGTISWNAPESDDVRYWTLYKRNNNNVWELEQVLNGTTTSARVYPGNYALRAVDRLANESVEKVITVN
ncbi:MAG: family 10 glycosylhydrolase [Oscillatoria sp. SIO1A7]|nr:family 10 glycosylhydrolase [Oscillatoria sp. SIO1A7]